MRYFLSRPPWAVGFEAARRILEEADPDAIAVFSIDHFDRCFYDNLPAFLVGVAEEAAGPPYDTLAVPKARVRVMSDLGRFIVDEGLERGASSTRQLNAMTPALIAEFGEALRQIEKDPEIKVLVIRGAGRAFSTGYDLTGGWGEGAPHPFTLDDDQRFLQRYVEHWLRLRDLPKPVIAMVHGYCLAGATQLCISSDMIFVADDARIGFPSIPAGAGYVSAFWNWMVGPHRTKYLAFLPGSRISGKEAEAMGFATRAFPAAMLEQETYDYARRVTKVPAQKLRLEKTAINRAMDLRGFRTTVLAGAEFDAIFHFGPGNDEIRQVQKERGLKGAIQWYEEK